MWRGLVVTILLFAAACSGETAIEPTAEPTTTTQPTAEPTDTPTPEPTAEPTVEPTATPEPTAEPTPAMTAEPTIAIVPHTEIAADNWRDQYRTMRPLRAPCDHYVPTGPTRKSTT